MLGEDEGRLEGVDVRGGVGLLLVDGRLLDEDGLLEGVEGLLEGRDEDEDEREDVEGGRLLWAKPTSINPAQIVNVKTNRHSFMLNSA